MEDKHEHHKTLDVKKRASASTEVGKSLEATNQVTSRELKNLSNEDIALRLYFLVANGTDKTFEGFYSIGNLFSCIAANKISNQKLSQKADDQLEKQSFVQTLTSGTDVKIEMSINASNYAKDDFRELLSFIATSSREFYLTIAQKLNNKP